MIGALMALAALAAPAAVAVPENGGTVREDGDTVRERTQREHAPQTPAQPRTHGWEISSAGRLSSGAHLSSVTSAGRDAAWAVGHQRFDGVADGVLLSWNGERWRQDRTPGLPDVDYWHSVSAASARDVWAYGWSQTEETMARYDGARWRRVPLPELPGEQIHGFSELATAHGRAWLAGNQWIHTYEGGRWRTTDLGSGTGISDVYARTGRDAWAVGGFSLVGHESRPVALHWDGARWHETALPDRGIRLANVYAESARSVWASGFTTPVGEERQAPKVLHWDGRTWRDVTGPVAGLAPQALSGDGRGGVWLSGDPDGWEGPPVFWHYGHKRWTKVHGATLPEGTTQAYNVTDLAPAGHTGRQWAVGSYELLDGQGSSFGYEFIQRSRH
ncbi:hypothetical protein DVA86_28980 [Streptomyces armeniacus]|uniref:Uncharacterized protein n=1 Tax=Streptomyces armeniacus TaxID=83291 RepID=A0A345XWM4_9ACTN|nr:hypothetical protein DVA86_28980 [Streptomyces armeniacus]